MAPTKKQKNKKTKPSLRYQTKRFAKKVLRDLGVDIQKYRNPHSPLESLIEKLDRPVEVVLDIGANEGQSAHVFLDIFPSAKIFCFEPIPDVLRSLEAKFAEVDRIIPIPKALAETEGKHIFSINSHSDMSSLLQPATGDETRTDYHGGGHVVDTIEVDVSTVDIFLENHHIDHVNVVKIDVEGAELACLKGAECALNRQKIDVLFVEIGFIPRYKNEASYLETIGFLKSRDYTLYDLSELKHAKDGQLRMANAIFVSSLVRRQLSRNL